VPLLFPAWDIDPVTTTSTPVSSEWLYG